MRIEGTIRTSVVTPVETHLLHTVTHVVDTSLFDLLLAQIRHVKREWQNYTESLHSQFFRMAKIQMAICIFAMSFFYLAVTFLFFDATYWHLYFGCAVYILPCRNISQSTCVF